MDDYMCIRLIFSKLMYGIVIIGGIYRWIKICSELC